MSSRLFIHAPNVHAGGGRSLLYSIISSKPADVEVILTADERLVIPPGMLRDEQIRRVPPTFIGRFSAERWLARNVRAGDFVLAFGNLPPLFKSLGRVVTFVQNRYLVDDVNLGDFPLKSRLRLVAERYWLSARLGIVDELIVQTPSMKSLLESRLKADVKISILPFIAGDESYSRDTSFTQDSADRDYDFIYVASGDPHKNHRQLIEAWSLLAAEGIFPSLLLTLEKKKCAGLCAWIEQVVDKNGLRVTNCESSDIGGIEQLYKSSGALIYPSTIESLGLPLIEARQAGLPVIASELDFVRDVLDPDQSFDPDSSISIARAVKRFLKIDEQPLALRDTCEFIEHVMGKSEQQTDA